jgi:hypothetical protein
MPLPRACSKSVGRNFEADHDRAQLAPVRAPVQPIDKTEERLKARDGFY